MSITEMSSTFIHRREEKSTVSISGSPISESPTGSRSPPGSPTGSGQPPSPPVSGNAEVDDSPHLQQERNVKKGDDGKRFSDRLQSPAKASDHHEAPMPHMVEAPQQSEVPLPTMAEIGQQSSTPPSSFNNIPSSSTGLILNEPLPHMAEATQQSAVSPPTMAETVQESSFFLQL